MVDQFHVADDIPAYALGVLDSAEEKQFIAHLTTCDSCQAELRAYQEVVGMISLAAPLAQPPLHLKDKILSQAVAAPQVPVRPIAPSMNEKPNWWNQIRAWLSVAPVFRLSGAFLVLMLVASNLFFWQQLSQVTAMQRHGYASVLLEGTTSEPKAKGMVVYTMDGKSGFLVVNNLSQSQKDKQYQLWLIKGNKRSNGGTFSVGESGYAVMEIDSAVLLTSYDGFGITIEPVGGSPGPTGPKVLGGKF